MTPGDLIGTWSIERAIKDDLAGATYVFSGTADIADSLYQERGDLILSPGQSVHSTRNYNWEFSEDRIEVCFSDGGFFHTIHFGKASQAAHFCDPDQYDVKYDFLGSDEWTSEWCVKGPRKKYQMLSRYRKQSYANPCAPNLTKGKWGQITSAERENDDSHRK